jgi:hypothetical protein
MLNKGDNRKWHVHYKNTDQNKKTHLHIKPVTVGWSKL